MGEEDLKCPDDSSKLSTIIPGEMPKVRKGRKILWGWAECPECNKTFYYEEGNNVMNYKKLTTTEAKLFMQRESFMSVMFAYNPIIEKGNWEYFIERVVETLQRTEHKDKIDNHLITSIALEIINASISEEDFTDPLSIRTEVVKESTVPYEAEHLVSCVLAAILSKKATYEYISIPSGLVELLGRFPTEEDNFRITVNNLPELFIKYEHNIVKGIATSFKIKLL